MRPARVLGLVLILTAHLAHAQEPAAAAAAPEVVGEVRIHGNYRTPDAEVISLSGLAVGQKLEANAVELITQRLRRSGRFDDVEVRKLGRSLSDPADVALIIIVRERPGADPLGILPGPLGRLGDSLMMLPVLDYVDGYGVTIGGRFSFVNVLGKDGMVSVPLTWGGTKRAAIEIDKRLAAGPVSRLQASASVSSRHNPFFDLADRRNEVTIDVSKPLFTMVNLAGRAGWTDVSMGAVHDHFTSYGARLSLDSRTNPAFPRNAVFAAAGWDHLAFRGAPGVDRFSADLRGYLGLPATSVLAVRGLVESANGPLPSFEKPLLGGAGNLRGFRAGSFAGDNLVAASVELRVPTTSPMRFGQSGIVLFADAGAVWNHGGRLTDARVERGYGAGWYLVAPLFRFNAYLGDRRRQRRPRPRRHGTEVLRLEVGGWRLAAGGWRRAAGGAARRSGPTAPRVPQESSSLMESSRFMVRGRQPPAASLQPCDSLASCRATCFPSSSGADWWSSRPKVCARSSGASRSPATSDSIPPRRACTSGRSCR